MCLKACCRSWNHRWNWYCWWTIFCMWEGDSRGEMFVVHDVDGPYWDVRQILDLFWSIWIMRKDEYIIFLLFKLIKITIYTTFIVMLELWTSNHTWLLQIRKPSSIYTNKRINLIMSVLKEVRTCFIFYRLQQFLSSWWIDVYYSYFSSKILVSSCGSPFEHLLSHLWKENIWCFTMSLSNSFVIFISICFHSSRGAGLWARLMVFVAPIKASQELNT